MREQGLAKVGRRADVELADAAGSIGSMVVPVAIVALVVALAATVAIAVAVRRVRRRNQVVPGHDSAAPGSWARAHTPEARLHRRLRDAMAALRSLPELGGIVPGTWAELERHAIGLDRRLVSVAAVPESVRGPALAQVTTEVEAIEAAAGALASRASPGSSRPDEVVRALVEHAASLDDARAEVDALDTGRVAPQDDT